jgi:hypothetical protein
MSINVEEFINLLLNSDESIITMEKIVALYKKIKHDQYDINDAVIDMVIILQKMYDHFDGAFVNEEGNVYISLADIPADYFEKKSLEEMNMKSVFIKRI